MVAVFLVIVASFTAPYMINPARDASEKTVSVADTRAACDKLANSMNLIYNSGDNSVDSVGVSISQTWDLEIQSDPPILKMTVHVDGKSVEVKNKLDYGFDVSKTSLSPGYYTVTVVKKDTDGLTKSDNKIKISLNPEA